MIILKLIVLVALAYSIYTLFSNLKHKVKTKPWVYGVLAACILAFFVLPSDSPEKIDRTEPLQEETSQNSIQTKQAKKPKKPAKINAESEADESMEMNSMDQDNVSVQSKVSSSEAETIVLIAGKTTDYAISRTLNPGTNEELERIYYAVPSGTYTVTNKGEYPTQVTAYKDEVHVTEEGWEEWADGTPLRLEVNETKDLEIPDGWFVYIGEPTKIEMTKKY